MLKKFLTTIIVLAATATAWADGYGYTLDKDGARATITTGEQTLEEVITAIKGLTPTVQYVILPDGMTKEEVNSIATANGFVVAVSKNEATTTETKWVYTYNEEEFIYEGTPTTIDGVSKANVTVFVPLTVTESSYKLGDNDYNRTVFYDSDGNCYGVNNESDIFNLTTNGKGYTYNNGATEYTGKVAESEGKYYGVINNPTEVALELNKPVSWTYNLNCDNSITYAHFGEVYNYYGNNIFWQGGTEYDLTTETRYTYDEYGQKKLYTGATRTADGITYGNTGTSFNVSYVNAYTYNDNGIIKVYTGATRTDADGKTYGNTGSGEVTLTSKQAYTYNDNGIKVYTGPVRTTVVDGKTQYYGNTGEMFSLTTTKNAPRTYDSGKYIYEGEYISGANGNVGGTFYELIKFTATAENPVYTYIDYGTWPHTLYLYLASDVDENGKVNGQETTKNTSGDFYYYTKDNKKYQYNSDIYTKLDGTGQYACEGGTVVNNVEQATENVKYYTDTDNKIVYTGNVYTDNDDKEYGVKDIYSDKDLTYGTVYYNGDVLFTGNVYDKTTNEGTVKVGYTTNPYEIPLEKKNVYVKDDNITVYSGNVYTKDDKSVGFENGAEKELTLGEVKVYNKDGQILIATDNSRISLDGDTYCEGGNAIGLTKEEGTANLYTYGEGRSVIYTGKVYGDATGYIGGTETELAYGDIYKKEDGTIYTGYRNEDNTKGCNNPQKLTTLFTYEYENPNNKEETVTFTDTQHLTTKEVDYTATVEQKEIEVPTGKIHLIAYVSTPGSLVDGISDWAEVTGTGYYNAGNVTALTLSGTVNAKDIYCSGDYVDQYGNACFYENGKIKWNKTDSQAIGFGEPVALKHAFVTYIDLEDAVFPVQTDMQFGYVNTGLQTVKLPTDKSMTLIPDHAFDNLHYVSELCIPYNYTTIGSCAFHNTHALMHIYTTDNPEDASDDETIVDYGPYTYTFSANLKQIEGGIGVNSTFFGNHIEDVTDIYVLAEKAPLCGANAFAGSMTYGNNGFAGNWTHPICRENYINSNKWICVLHYPSSSTDEEAANYTDITRNYTLIDEVGNVDGDGRPIAWPRHAEFYRAYNQAIKGYIWYDWKEYDDGSTEVIQSYTEGVLSDKVTGYKQEDYQGWHEFVLVGNSRSRDFDPQKENREYIQRDWYTICVPYDLTKSQLLNMLGVVNSEDDETVYALEENEGKWEVSETGTTITQNLYPDVRALTHVSRDINENGTYVFGKVTLHLSEPLISVDENGKVTCSHVDINGDGQGYTHATLEGDDPIVMEGGHAYLIRPYVPKEWNDQIKNLGMYIMAMADSYNNAAVSAGLPAPYSYNEDCKFENKVYLPCFKHKIHAVKGNVSPNASARNIPEFVYEDAEGQSPAYYRFVGTYTQTTVPQYAYYLGKNKTTGAHQFFRTTKETTKWNPYSAVIVGLSSNPNYTGVDTSGQTGIQSVGFVSDNENDLRALAGEVTNPSNAGKSLSFEQLMGDANGEATGIVDVNVNSNVNVGNNKVYSINGQYMGTSLNKLPKGIYIINGQKKVVK